jgi:hypothetical protein
MEIEAKTDDINADIMAAMDGLENGSKVEVKEPEAIDPAKEEIIKEDAQKQEPETKAPQSWGGAVKSEWAKLPETVRSEILKRENDIHQMVTRHDGELRLGREIKEVVTPYMSIIQAEGGTPATAVRDLLNTAYVLRTGSPEQKKQLILNTAKQFGIELNVGEEQEYVDPAIAALQKEIQELRQQANPENIQKTLLEQIEQGKVEADIKAFASDPANVHFETVRPLMVAMLNAGQAANLKEAYDMACMANPQIRSTLEAQKAAELQAKRKQENEAKRRAASSLTGSPAVPGNSKVNNPKASVEDDLRAAFDAVESKF